MCSELYKDFYVVYQLEMVAGEVESSCQLVVTFFFFFFFGLTLPNYRNKSGSAQRSPPSYQLLPPPLIHYINRPRYSACIMGPCTTCCIFILIVRVTVAIEYRLEGRIHTTSTAVCLLHTCLLQLSIYLMQEI